jgi:AraC-like DNA-binding protein
LSSAALACTSRWPAASSWRPVTPSCSARASGTVTTTAPTWSCTWTLPELAEQLHLAPGYLVRVFKAGTGLPPMAYLARLRAEMAATLLLRTDQPVTAIGRAVGWPDQNYFARRFKAHYGLSATTYRARFAAHATRLRRPGAEPDRPEAAALAVP